MKTRDFGQGFILAGSAAAAAGVAAYRVAARQAPQSNDESELAAATSTLRKKNDQLESLYTVFSEITESLVIRYVIASTLRETLKLMRADMAVLRKVSGDELVSIGALASTGQEIQHIRPV